MNIVLHPEITDLFPGARVAALVCRGLDNSPGRPRVDEAIQSLEQHALETIFEGAPATHPYLSAWRAAYRAFGTDPRSTPVSSEALLKRFRKARSLPRISPAVDIYNLISVRHVLPIGGYDLDSIDGDIVLTRAEGGESFLPLGRYAQPEETTQGEVIYRDSSRVLTRHWNHRDGAHTAIANITRNAAFFCEAPDETIAEGSLIMALEELRSHLVHTCGGEFTDVIVCCPKSPTASLLDYRPC